MSEIIDFLIELFTLLSGKRKNFYEDYNSIMCVSPDERMVILEHLDKHLSRDPATANLIYQHVLVFRTNNKMKVVLLDSHYKRLTTIRFSNFLNSKWGKGRIDVSLQ